MAYAECKRCVLRDAAAEPEAAEYLVNGFASCRLCIEWLLDNLASGGQLTIRRLRLIEQAEMAR